eukprot:CAMPEP_0172693448 /NCGR_PEP_ID=MMETSP1074-20121228/25998_1 /TAXON_ID=2916 /ORGANISM="Ceratium fusus, Strain PA161109" /LENGTH=80 /DNA_ID=CAMNT_0013513821 /DNA_START=579 /DNA_END=821 /DNA_ORIENTATION=-
MGGGAPGVLSPTYAMLPPARGLPICPGTEILRLELSLNLAQLAEIEPASFLLPWSGVAFGQMRTPVLRPVALEIGVDGWA